MIIKEVNEVWYYMSEEGASRHNKEESVGYTKTVNGIAITVTGRTTKFGYVKSRMTSEN